MCPVHALWHGFFEGLAMGATPWARVSAGEVRRKLRVGLVALSVANAESYSTHDFRRGHAKDLQDSGAPLSVILAAGGWRSAAFITYLDGCELEKEVVLEAAVLSEEELWID